MLRICTPPIEAEAEKLLAGRTRDIRLSRAMMTHYQSWSWPRRAKVVRAWMLWVAGLNIFLAGLGWLFVPSLFLTALLFMGLFVPAANLAIHGLWKRPRGPWIEPVSLIVVTIVTMLGYGGFGTLIGGDELERYLTGALFLATIGVVVFDMSRAWSTAFGALAITVFSLFQIFNVALDPSQAIFSIAFFGAGVVATVEARRTLTILAYKSFLLTVRDAAQKRALAEANQSLHKLATLDPLTGVANRRSVKEHTDRLWRDPSVNKNEIAMIMADLDHFKRLNDAFGHAVGDACICRVADALVSSTRKGLDLVARYGGEEFMIVLTKAPPETVLMIAERIRIAVSQLEIADAAVRTGVLSVTVSLGVAVAEEGVGAELLASRADDALYEAKRQGRNRICVAQAIPYPLQLSGGGTMPGQFPLQIAAPVGD